MMKLPTVLGAGVPTKGWPAKEQQRSKELVGAVAGTATKGWPAHE